MESLAPQESLSLLTPIGYQKTKCGYCKSATKQSFSYYLNTTRLNVEHYEDLINHGWRRSGTTLYKPDLKHSCCPHYTIRLDSTEFRPSKDQRQTLNRWAQYVLGENYVSEAAKLFPKSKAESKKRKNEFNLSSAVHDCETPHIKAPLRPDHAFEVTLEPANFSKEKYKVFENYQRCVHKEDPSDISESGFANFLCGSPLVAGAQNEEKKLGSFHQCYRLNGRLIAMGVVDLLPNTVSGVYFAYHEDVSAWQFGKLGALRETALARESGYKYYYMGYYIHSCTKMRYKGDYRPQYILDPESYAWSLLDDYRHLLDRKSYVSLFHEEKMKSEQNSDPIDGDQDMASASSDFGRMTSKDLGEKQNKTIKNSIKMRTEDHNAIDVRDSLLFETDMPGVMQLEDVFSRYDLDNLIIRLKGRYFLAQDLNWREYFGPVFAELAACLPPSLVEPSNVAIDFD